MHPNVQLHMQAIVCEVHTGNDETMKRWNDENGDALEKFQNVHAVHDGEQAEFKSSV